jgi:O-antigen/teichoic acid export membrane protein
MDSTLKDKTAKGLLWGMMNNGVMQLLNIVFGIVLARLLSDADYGLAGELAIFTAIASALQESGFISALTNRKNASQQDYNSVFWFNVGCSAIMYVVLWFCAPFIVRFFNEPELLWLSRYAFTGFFFASFSITPRAMLFKQMKVREQTIIGISSLILSGIVGITMAVCGMTYWSVVTQNIVFVATVSVLSWYFSGFRPSWSFNFQPIREMFGFSCKLLVTNIFNCINNNVFSLLFGRFYTKHEVGQYTQADKWNKMGSNMITGMVQQVAQPMFVQVGDDKERLVRAFRKMLRFTSLISFPALFGLVLVAPQFITIAVGEKWLPSAEIMQVLCVAGAFMPIATLYQNLLISRGKSGVYMWNILCQGLTVIAMLCCVKYMGWQLTIPFFGSEVHLAGIRLMVVCYVVIYLLWMFLWHAFLQRQIPISLTTALKDVLPFAFVAAASMTIAYFLTRGIENIYLLLASRILLAAALYLGIIWMTGAKILRESLYYLKRKKQH